MKASTSPARFSGAVAKSVLILDVLPGDGDLVGVSEVARRTSLPKTTAHRLLGLLTDLGLAERHATGYRLGRHVSGLVRSTPCMQHDGLRDQLLPFLLDLQRLTDEAVHLGVLRDQGVLCVERLFGHRSAPVPIATGTVLPAHGTALGKVLLAFGERGSGELGREGELTAYTSLTIITRRALQRELETVRDAGFAHDRGEYIPGIGCVAAPLWGPGHTLVGALSVSAPARRLDPTTAVKQLWRIANAASQSLLAAEAA
ncbi:IclR family transcriptional regulator [Actinocrinis sp.]|uniref:IclR family transcriptional regulator n=1 Tax=Actinocrinis sp. TaxID=1920516 RepID=UPI002CA8AC35|nr:IclR family transcriptional regulator [Actinocrinis sp.]HXR71089.1 IclR family transcriptional regulator [Actinocrinis sp.]